MEDQEQKEKDEVEDEYKNDYEEEGNQDQNIPKAKFPGETEFQ